MPDVIAYPDPTCRAPARVIDRWIWGSTCGPVEHVKTSCKRGHWFTPTADSLDLRPAPMAAEPPPLPVPVDHRRRSTATRKQPIVQDRKGKATGDQAPERMLADVPVTQRRLQLAGVTTAVLEGGNGKPLVLLHCQGGWAAGWLPALPDLPGLGASETPQGPPDTATVLAWLGELIDAT